MKNRRNPWVLLLLLLAGALIGGIAGEALVRFPYFQWVSFGGVNGYRDLFAFSMHPALDLRVLKFGFDLSLSINAGSIVGMILGILVYLRT
ncbi:MAG: DUF4321 domain-containing protein [Clostridia bacterium]|nr:DUF4321 domain-containing protein [Clostridia bacterium]